MNDHITTEMATVDNNDTVSNGFTFLKPCIVKMKPSRRNETLPSLTVPKLHRVPKTAPGVFSIWVQNLLLQFNSYKIISDTVQKLFIQAYNQLMQNRKEVIEDCEEWCRVLTDFADLDKEIEQQYEETQVVAELVKAAVSENASTAQSQEDYLKKYEALTQRYDTAVAALAELQATRAHKEQQNKQMSLFIRTLKKQPEILDIWNNTIWMVMVEKAIVHRDGQISFVFYNGAEIEV